MKYVNILHMWCRGAQATRDFRVTGKVRWRTPEQASQVIGDRYAAIGPESKCLAEVQALTLGSAGGHSEQGEAAFAQEQLDDASAPLSCPQDHHCDAIIQASHPWGEARRGHRPGWYPAGR